MVKNEPGTIRTRFKIKLAEKETREGRNYSYRQIQEQTGIATSTLTAWASGKAKFFSADVLAALCLFFECQPGDLLEYIPPSSADKVT